MLIAQSVTRKSTDLALIKKLYREAFPPHERFPFWLILQKAKRSSVEFLAFYDSGICIGFLYAVTDDDLMYLMFLAVSPQSQSRGYGSQILQYLETVHPAQRIALEMEVPDNAAPNNEQRLKRLAFYEKNGFVRSAIQVVARGECYEILTKNGTCSKAELQSLIKRWSGCVLYPLFRMRFAN